MVMTTKVYSQDANIQEHQYYVIQTLLFRNEIVVALCVIGSSNAE